MPNFEGRDVERTVVCSDSVKQWGKCRPNRLPKRIQFDSRNPVNCHLHADAHSRYHIYTTFNKHAHFDNGNQRHADCQRHATGKDQEAHVNNHSCSGDFYKDLDDGSYQEDGIRH